MTDELPQALGEQAMTAPNSSAVYQALAARRVSYDQMMWQVPALSLTAQSFLVAVAVNASLAVVIRMLALVLAIVSGALSMQLMAKQRFHEQVDTWYLRKWEGDAQIWPVAGFTPHDPAIAKTGPGKADALGLHPSRWVTQSSYKWWMWGLRVFMATMIGLLIWVLVSA